MKTGGDVMRTMLLRIVLGSLLVTLGAWVSGCGEDSASASSINGSQEECSDTEPCTNGSFCVHGRCIALLCSETNPCPQGYNCFNGACISTYASVPGDTDVQSDTVDVEFVDGSEGFEGEGEGDASSSCEPGETICHDETTIAVCLSDGSGWETSNCPSDEICLVDVCIPQQCTPDAYGDCQDRFTYTQCNMLGTGWESGECEDGFECIAEQGCQAIACEPDSPVECLDTLTLIACDELGTGYVQKTCEGDAVCYQNDCRPVVCEPGAYDCSDEILKFCNYLGTGFDEVMDCGSLDLVCTQRGCFPRICETDETGCSPSDDRTVTYCAENGTEWVELFECEEGTSCRGGECLDACGIAAYDRSYVGCEYWPVDLYNASREGNDDSEFGVAVYNPHDTRSANIEIRRPSGSSSIVMATGSVGPGGLSTFLLGNTLRLGAASKSLSAYRLNSDIPVSVVQMNPSDNGQEIHSNDATLLLPSGNLGKEYFNLTLPHLRSQKFSIPISIGQRPSGFVVVGTYDGITNVTVTVPVPTRSGTNLSAMSAGQTRTFQLQQYEVLNLATVNKTDDQCTSDIFATTGCYDYDLSGAFVTSDREIAAFGTHACVFVPEDQWACDHIEHQLLPLTTWGKEYFAIRPYPRNATYPEAAFYRIIASEDGTHVTTGVTGHQSFTLNAGGIREFMSRETHFRVSADKPIQVGQFLVSQDATGIDDNNAEAGDPAFMLLAPDEQFRKDYTFLVPPYYALDYITLIAPVGAQVLLDDVAIEADEWETASSDFNYHQRLMTDGVHRIESDMQVGLYVYGYSRYVSYAYVAGLSLQEINPKE